MRYKKDELSVIDKVYDATTALLKEKDYDSLSMSEIIRYSKVSRSTFYVYFKNKDQILLHICNDIFDHVFSHKLNKEQSHDFSHNDDIKEIFVHSLHHFLLEKEVILAILNSSGSSIFLSQLRKRIKPLIVELINSKDIGNNNVPFDIKIHQYINGYVALVQYYLRHGEDLSPEKISEYFFEIYK